MNGEAADKADEAIRAFFSWWESARKDIEHAYGFSGERWTAYKDPEPTREMVAPVIQKRVDAISECIFWEIGRDDKRRRFTFSLSGFSDPEKVALCERWEASAPTDNNGWLFHGRSLPDTLRDFSHEGVLIRAEAFRVTSELNPETLRLDVRMGHPAFGKLDPVGQARVAVFAIHHFLGGTKANAHVGSLICDAALENGDPMDSLTAQVRKAFLHSDAQRAFSEFFEVWNSALLIADVRRHGWRMSKLLRRVSGWLEGPPFDFQIRDDRFYIVTGPHPKAAELARRLVASGGDQAKEIRIAEAFHYDHEAEIDNAIEAFAAFWAAKGEALYDDPSVQETFHEHMKAIRLRGYIASERAVAFIDGGDPAQRALGERVARRVKEHTGRAPQFHAAATVKDFYY